MPKIKYKIVLQAPVSSAFSKKKCMNVNHIKYLTFTFFNLRSSETTIKAYLPMNISLYK